MELDEINDKTVEGLKRISKAEVGISVKKKGGRHKGAYRCEGGSHHTKN